MVPDPPLVVYRSCRLLAKELVWRQSRLFHNAVECAPLQRSSVVRHRYSVAIVVSQDDMATRLTLHGKSGPFKQPDYCKRPDDRQLHAGNFGSDFGRRRTGAATEIVRITSDPTGSGIDSPSSTRLSRYSAMASRIIASASSNVSPGNAAWQSRDGHRVPALCGQLKHRRVFVDTFPNFGHGRTIRVRSHF